jgi:hypothetical protein
MFPINNLIKIYIKYLNASGLKWGEVVQEG